MRVRITGDGTPFGTRVEDEFGRLLPVTKMSLEINSEPGGHSGCVVWLAPGGVELKLDFDAAVGQE